MSNTKEEFPVLGLVTAWKYLALTWKMLHDLSKDEDTDEDTDNNSKPQTRIYMGRTAISGLCQHITSMNKARLITTRTASIMMEMLHLYHPLPEDCATSPYYWPCTVSGATQRAAFCLKMAKLSRRSKRSKP